jgi:hypothetical protein
MEKPKLEFPEAVGKLVAELAVYDDALHGREVLVRFTDGTQISVCVGVEQIVEVRCCNEDTPDTPIWTRRD